MKAIGEGKARSTVRDALRTGRPSPRVGIIGAGAAGICMGIKLSEAGIDTFTIFEKSDGVGGTWRDNTYPGAACDIPSHLYSFSFASKRDWRHRFARQPEILGYLEDLTDTYGLRRHIRFGHEVDSITLDETSNTWTVTTVDGASETVDVVISGLGQLNRPYVPDIAGLDTFEGATMHSARWDHSCDLGGRSVAVIGNGASALQFIPEVAGEAADLTIFQRSANWILPKDDVEFSSRMRGVMTVVPGAQRLYRWWIYWRLEILFSMLRRGSLLGRLLSRRATEALQALISDDLPAEALVPDYPPGCKRVLISHNYYQTLLRPDVKVELDHIDHIDNDSIVTENGTRHRVDAIILGTGFRTTEFLAPMEVIGRDGRSLNDVWKRGAEAYLGVAVSGFPNFFMLYGPNTNLGHNSIFFMIEAQARYVITQIARTIESGAAYLDVRPSAEDRWNAAVQRNADKTVWASDCSSWYKNEDGRITNNWTSWSIAYWRRMRRFVSEDYMVGPALRPEQRP